MDVGLTDPFDSVTALWYSKWALENVPQPQGGRTVWLSNWVPSIWSVRQNAAGENFQLAYAFFKAGLAEEGYDILRGTVVRDGFNSLQPGYICSEAASLLARVVVCGLHGYQPDYPHHRLLLSPQYPEQWTRASIQTSYFSCDYQRNEDGIRYCFSLEQAANVTLRMPLPGEKILKVNGAKSWKLEPGFGYAFVVLELGEVQQGAVEIFTQGHWEKRQPMAFPSSPGETVRISSDTVLELRDPQKVTCSHSLLNGILSLNFAQTSGCHQLFLLCEHKGIRYYRIVVPTLSPTAKEIAAASLERVEPDLSHNYSMIEMKPYYNADVREIFSQEYLSPRPQGIHLSIGSDGYSPWTFTFWKNPPPKVELSPSLPSAGGRIKSQKGVPLSFGGFERNIAFTSLWDNWPTDVSIPIGQSARAAYVLLAGSTNRGMPIANAVLRFIYQDGFR